MKTVPGFNVEVRRKGATVLVAPTGEVDLATEGELRDALDGVGRCEVLVLEGESYELLVARLSRNAARHVVCGGRL